MHKFTAVFLLNSVLLGYFTEDRVKANEVSSTYLENKLESEKMYNFVGNASKKATFIINKEFIDSLDNGKLCFNGYIIKQNTNSDVEYKKVFDSQVIAISNNKAKSISFYINDELVSLSDVKKVYNKDKLKHIPYTNEDARYPEDGAYIYKGDKIYLQFEVSNNYLTFVTLGSPETE
ncbi:hypothetical protein MTQ93_11970 [Staphylococcus agnetis]|uniref:immunodominant staphylococcal antigen IsaB family protein n=1 Tax=Staphylococcus agnetis TaxID=985762 RepID=UPI00208E52A9|nr:hypothetical protein [Staphylococcus agnetis]MCO4346749.1 hypothetical protein [Staphylococcus agnetis]MCO4365827.1 hypothetical protein [Staphylococcus agnetis]